jgi:protein Mpv17
MSVLFSRYSSWLTKRPLASRLITGVSLFTCGDLISQTLIEKRGIFSGTKKVNLYRTLRTSLLAATVICPGSYMWYQKFLPRILATPRVQAFSTNLQNMFGTFLDQACYTVGITSVFFIATNFMQTLSIEKALNNCSENLLPTMKTCWSFWPALIFANLCLVPPHFHFTFISFFSLWWNCYLSYKSNMKQVEESD